MEIEVMKKLIKNNQMEQRRVIKESIKADRYYRKKNDILTLRKKAVEDGSPLRNADNRIPSSFYSILVNQKASYMFTAPPAFDTYDKGLNKQIVETLGDKYPKVCKDLCINASNSSVSWLHVWKNEAGEFKYGVVDAKQIRPIWGSDLDRKLLAVLRTYDRIDDNGDIYNIYEYWDELKCYAFQKKNRETLNELQAYNEFQIISDAPEIFDESNEYEHDFEEVPFIPFFNNNTGENDLVNVKCLIDSYDKVYSGFIDDLEDIQEVIFVLSGYEGQDLNEFHKNLKKYKTIKTESNEDGKGGLTTLTINIPVEAREKMLNMTRKAIFEQGQGIDPDPQNFGNSSGVALSYLYSLLELKAGLMETEFKMGFGMLIRMLCKHLGKEPKQITQVWARTSVRNDSELAAIAAQSMGTISNKTIIKNHPWVEDVEQEQKQLEEEKTKQEEKMNIYGDAFGNGDKEKQTGGDVDAKEEW